ncbi:MAG: DMT family transporter [Planctomycetia bacterium]|nr:DMT family transporter [Planctomycetia bacterium]
MKPTSRSPAHGTLGIDPFVLGTAFSALSSIAYSCSNVCLRWLAHLDPFLVSCVKAVPTMLVATTLLGAGVVSGRIRWPRMRVFAALAGVGVFAQLGGNGAFQWSLGQVGLAITVPLCSGTMIIAATVLGRVWLGEGVTPRSAAALALLIAAITVLSIGAERSPKLAELTTATAPVGLAIAAVCLAGVAYAVLNVLIRRLVTGSTQMPVVLATVSSVGVISLGLTGIARTGWTAIDQTALSDLGVMFVAGTFNAVGFFTLTKALQLVSIVQVNAVGASQSALAALAGVALFGENLTASLGLGVFLTMIGLALVDRGRRLHPPPEDEPPQTVEDDTVAVVPPVQFPAAAPLPREPTTR